jgi:hypothetical protein
MRDTQETLSARMKAVKRVMCVRRSVFYMPEGFRSSLLWWELEKAGYPLRKNDKNAFRKLEQDYNRHCELNFSREEDLSRIFWHGVQIIFGQPGNQRKNLAIAWLTILRISLGNESPNVMASVRAREVFQQNAFPGFKLMDRKEQNPKLTRLEKLGLGEFHKGEAYKRTDAGIFKLLQISDEPTDVDSLFASLASLLEMSTGSLLVGGSPKDRFLLIMDCLDAGFKAFLGYTIAQKEVNAAAKDEFKAANPLPPKPEKPKKVYKPRKYNPSRIERKMIEEGKAEIQDNKLVILTEPEAPEVQDWSHLLETPVEAPESHAEPLTPLDVHMRWVREESAKQKQLALATMADGLEF